MVCVAQTDWQVLLTDGLSTTVANNHGEFYEECPPAKRRQLVIRVALLLNGVDDSFGLYLCQR
jgi:ethanolamine ammonia-lyase small subunit